MCDEVVTGIWFEDARQRFSACFGTGESSVEGRKVGICEIELCGESIYLPERLRPACAALAFRFWCREVWCVVVVVLFPGGRDDGGNIWEVKTKSFGLVGSCIGEDSVGWQ